MTSSTAQSLSGLQQSVAQLRALLNERIIGQEDLVLRLLIGLLADGHLLVEGAPGLAKTTAIKTLAEAIHANFHRIQFTPDLLPADLTGTEIYRQQEGSFVFQPGPIFHQLVLADEINRAPAKVQSALLEAMGERQVTVGQKTYALPDLFMVMATQNPIEQEGTYILPEAQRDRFLLHVKVDYPQKDAERKILALNRKLIQQSLNEPMNKAIPIIDVATIMSARKALFNVHISEALENYIVQIILATRHPKPYGDHLLRWLRYGASPRGTISLDRASRAHAWLQGRDYVLPQDIQIMAYDVLRHRVLLSYEAEAEGVDSDQFIQALLQQIPVP